MKNKRQRFIFAVILLSFGLFFAEYQLGKSGVFVTLILSLLTDLLLLFTNYRDIKENFSYLIFILPFFYSLSFGLFYFLVPTRLLTRLIMTTFYAVGLYSLFLCQNIFTVASIRTIALLTGARIVSFVITLISYFFILNIIFTFHFSIIPTSILVFILSFPLILQSLWTVFLGPSIRKFALWALILSLCLSELSMIMWFWPTTPIVLSLFVSGIFYTMVGISQVWFEKRLFRGVMWEYIWVATIVFCILLVFTSWNT